MKKNYRTTCSICGSESISDAYLKNGFTICQCHECLSFFVKDTISKDSLSVYYQDATDEFVYDEANVKFLDFYFHRLKTLIENEIPNKGKILDIGCSSGYFLDVMEGWQCFGNEISPMQAALAQKNTEIIYKAVILKTIYLKRIFLMLSLYKTVSTTL